MRYIATDSGTEAVKQPKRNTKALLQAVQLQRSGSLDAAEAIYTEHLKEFPGDGPVLYNMGFLCQTRGEAFRAIEFYEKSVLSRCDAETKGDCMNNMGFILDRWGHADKAAIAFGFAYQFNPRKPEIVNNFANALTLDLKFSEADKEYSRILQMKPNDAEAKFNRSVVSLVTGDLLRGFQEYEWRWRWKGFSTKPYETNKPRWKGEDVRGKTVLLTAEQGFGDSIMMIRYAKLVKERGAMVHFYGHELLRRLFAGADGVDHFVNENEVEAFDYHSPLLSLPRIFKTTLETVPCDVPYIHPHPDWLPINCEALTRPGLKVGICWAGSPKHAKDKLRSVEPERFQPLIDALPAASFFSLQVGPRAGEVARLKNVIDLAPIITDYSETANALLQLDLLISVDTSIVHLAGALNREVWMLCPFSPDWRWLLERETSPWFRRLWLVRQPARGDWERPFERVKETLLAKAG